VLDYIARNQSPVLRVSVQLALVSGITCGGYSEADLADQAADAMASKTATATGIDGLIIDSEG